MTSASLSSDGRLVLSGCGDGLLRCWELVWDYEFPEIVDWDEGARPYLEIFLKLHPPVRRGILQRTKLEFSEKDFDGLIKQLQYAGYGWLRPEGVRRKLEQMASEHR